MLVGLDNTQRSTGEPTCRAGAADVSGILQATEGILHHPLRLPRRAPQQSQLLLGQALPQRPLPALLPSRGGGHSPCHVGWESPPLHPTAASSSVEPPQLKRCPVLAAPAGYLVSQLGLQRLQLHLAALLLTAERVP